MAGREASTSVRTGPESTGITRSEPPEMTDVNAICRPSGESCGDETVSQSR